MPRLASLMPFKDKPESLCKTNFSGIFPSQKIVCCCGYLFILLISLVLPSLVLAKITSIDVQDQIENVERQLKQLELTIQSNRQVLSREEKNLVKYDIQLQNHIKKNEALELQLKNLQKKKAQLNQGLSNLEKAEHHNQKALRKHIQSKQKRSKYETLKLVLQQKSVHDLQQLSALYTYFIEAQGKQIKAINQMLKATQAQRLKVVQAEKSMLNLKQEFAEAQKSLEAKKAQQQAAITAYRIHLSSDLEQQKKLNQQHHELNELFEQIQSTVDPMSFTHEKHFANMAGKLPLPIKIPSTHLKAISSTGVEATYIKASEGTQVRAIFPGRVIFSDWLRGIGLLIIIDHGQGYMSLYGNNQVLYKSAGDWVKAGEQISSVGQSGGLAQPGLYFEIRKDGKALDTHSWIRQG